MAIPKGPLLAVRLVVEAPPAGVAFAVQEGKGKLFSRTISTGADLCFDFTVELTGDPGGTRDFRGPFVQGKRGERFVYLNSGTLAGQEGSCWTRRAKIHLRDLPWKAIAAAGEAPAIEGRVCGTGRDGGPSCASVPLEPPGWRVAR